MNTIKVFLAHPKDQEDIESLKAQVIQTLTPLLPPDAALEVTLARDSFLAWEQLRGKPVNWKAWQEYVTGTTSAIGGAARYQYFVVTPSDRVGRGTADLVSLALKRRIPVLVWNGEALSQVRTVYCANAKDWKGGYMLS